MTMIRSVTANDRDAWLAMMDDFYHSEAVLHAIPRESMENTFRALTEGSPYAAGYVIEREGRSAGYALLSFTWSNEVGGKVVWIEELYLKPGFRGQGLGGEFFRWLHREFGDARRFRLEVSEENDDAARLYRRLGYTPLDYRQMVFDPADAAT